MKLSYCCFIIVMFSIYYPLSALTETSSSYELTVVTTADTYLYSDFKEGLYPFSHSLSTLKLEQGTILKVVEEIRPVSPLFSDVLKVSVASGYYKGKSGYIPELYVRFAKQLRLSVKVIFTRDIYDSQGQLLIPELTSGTITGSKYISNFESFIITPALPGKSVTYHCFDKDEVVFINSRVQEITYHLQRDHSVFKIVDAGTLLPIKGAVIDKTYVSDDYGLVYCGNMKPALILEAPGYVSRTVETGSLTGVNLVLLQKARVFKGEQESIRLREKGLEFAIQPGSNTSFVLNINEPSDYHFFTYPAVSSVKHILERGFYLESKQPLRLRLQKLPGPGPYTMLYYDELLKTWVKQARDEEGHFTILKGGYYLLTSSAFTTAAAVPAHKDTLPISRLLCMGKKGEYSIETVEGLALPAGECEILYFSPRSPYYIIRETLKSSGVREISLKPHGNKSASHRPAAFHRLFIGNWKSELVHKNGFPVASQEEGGYRLEFLGDMRLSGVNKVEFHAKHLVLEGYITVVNESRMLIYVNRSNRLLSFSDRTYKVSPSGYNSLLVIPAYYSLYAGFLQVSFDKIYLARHRQYRLEKSGQKPVHIGFLPSPFEKIVFPADEGKAVYVHYFRKIDNPNVELPLKPYNDSTFGRVNPEAAF